jgi:hypothetical protein
MIEGVTRRGHQATLFLVQNGVLGARRGAGANAVLGNLAAQRVNVLADGFSLRERGIQNVVPEVKSSGMSELVDLILEPGVKAVWH